MTDTLIAKLVQVADLETHTLASGWHLPPGGRVLIVERDDGFAAQVGEIVMVDEDVDDGTLALVEDDPTSLLDEIDEDGTGFAYLSDLYDGNVTTLSAAASRALDHYVRLATLLAADFELDTDVSALAQGALAVRPAE